MSYDLYFTKPKISKEEFDRYFQRRSNYTLNNSQAFYENKDTGVYFSFEHNEDAHGEDGDGLDYSVMFNINFFRPTYFILEAEPEVTAFVGHFQCEIEDPQGNGNAQYSPAELKRGWEHGNRFGYKAVLQDKDGPDKIFSRPEQELTAIWQWNHSKEALSAAMTEDIFIPRIMFAIFDGELASLCVWPDAISTLIPKVDRIWIPRSELAPRPLLGRRKDDECVIPFSAAVAVLQPYRVGGYSVDAYKLPAPITPPEIAAFVRKLSATKINVKGISLDQVLTRELADEARG